MTLPPAWYILAYHNVSWEDNAFTSSIGGTIPPDVFERHVREAQGLGQLLPAQEAARLYASGEVREPMLSFWFDDAMSGVVDYAAPILEEYQAAGAVSVCSEFTSHEDMFWRFKLSYLNSIDGLRFVRANLRPLGFTPKMKLKGATLDKFSLDVVAAIDEIYQRFTTADQRADAFRIFAAADDVRSLHENGWLLANHTARHYPVSEDSAIELFDREFLECQEWMTALLNQPPMHWVFPFDRVRHRSTELSTVRRMYPDQTFVFVGDRPNNPGGNDEPNELYRIKVRGKLPGIAHTLKRVAEELRR
jgi:peptidoglycan/xylan/chitin deacetylase (PgdA/CDA1 family)